MSAITDLGDFIRANPCAWIQLTLDQQSVAKAALLPDGAFTEEQRSFLSKWWLRCTQEHVDAINAALPRGTRVSAITRQGDMYLSGYLLTDALGEEGTYFSATTILKSLVASYFEYSPPVESAL